MFVFKSILKSFLFCLTFQINREQRADQENLNQAKTRKEDLLGREKELHEQRQQFQQRIDKNNEYIK